MADVPEITIVDGIPTAGSGTVQTLSNVTASLGASDGAAVVTDAEGTLQQYLRGLIKILAAALGPGTDDAALRVALASDDGLLTILDLIGAEASTKETDPDAVSAGLNALTRGILEYVKLSHAIFSDWDLDTAAQAIAGDVAHDAADSGNPVAIGGVASAAAPTNVTASDRVKAWFILNGAQAVNLTAAGALIPGDATNGLDVDITRMSPLVASSANIGDVDVLSLPALPAGTNAIGKLAANSGVDIGDVDVTSLPALVAGTALIGRVKPEGDEYETVAASQTAQQLGATSAIGDYLSHVQVQPTSTTVGLVTILDNAIEVHAYPGGTVSAALYPFTIPINAVSVSGAWKITTGAGVKCTAYGNFT